MGDEQKPDIEHDNEGTWRDGVKGVGRGMQRTGYIRAGVSGGGEGGERKTTWKI